MIIQAPGERMFASLLIASLTCQPTAPRADETPTFDPTSDVVNRGGDKATRFLERQPQVDDFQTIEIARLEIDIAPMGTSSQNSWILS
jgi:hypothetical protein